jgi:MoaA/NifB/PqqE/SkfB family radical SAM enzyme
MIDSSFYKDPYKQNPITKKHLPSCLQNRKGWADMFELKRTMEPHIHQIEPTNHCPYSCIMCPRPKHMKRRKGYMELSVYRMIIDEISDYSPSVRDKEIELFHFGESLLHPGLVDMINYASGKQLKIVLSVNGPLLNIDLAKKYWTPTQVR